MKKRHDPDGLRLPVKIDSTSNGEFEPIAISKANQEANKLALENATRNAKRTGFNRRDFLITSCGAATTLLAFNELNAQAGATGGSFDVDTEAALDPEIAVNFLDGEEFIFDVQGHFVDPNGKWIKENPDSAQGFFFAPKARCDLYDEEVKNSHIACLGPQEFVKDVFLDSDTDMMVLSFVPSTRANEPLTIEEADATRRIVDELEGNQRLMLHGRVNPNQDGDLDAMDELKERWNVCGWKTYTQYGPGGKGFFLSDEETGIPLIEKAIDLDLKVICIHKGLPFGPQSYEHSQCHDIGVVAKRYPDVKFLIYHSGFVAQKPEGPFEGEGSGDGMDTLIKSLIDNEIPPNSNVYAELGSTWRFLMRDPDNAAHGLGKLIKYCGENNVLWGTDSIWYGSPQDQIQAFRTFQISTEFQEKYGYAAMTPQLRAKIFGLNALPVYGIDKEEAKLRVASDEVSKRRQNYQNNPNPNYLTYGPKTRREFLNLKKWES